MVDVAFDGLKHVASYVLCSFPLQKDEFAIADYALVHTCKKMIRVSTLPCSVDLFVSSDTDPTAAPPPPSTTPLLHAKVQVCVCVFISLV